MAMASKEKMKACVEFFDELANLLSEEYEVVIPFDKTGIMSDKYLVPKGTTNDISYYGKPIYSFRVSTHWNWRESLDKCNNPNYIQCLCTDMPWAKKRNEPTGKSDPIVAASVAMIGDDNKYHVIFGEYWNKKTKTWFWLPMNPEVLAQHIKGKRFDI